MSGPRRQRGRARCAPCWCSAVARATAATSPRPSGCWTRRLNDNERPSFGGMIVVLAAGRAALARGEDGRGTRRYRDAGDDGRRASCPATPARRPGCLPGVRRPRGDARRSATAGGDGDPARRRPAGSARALRPRARPPRRRTPSSTTPSSVRGLRAGHGDLCAGPPTDGGCGEVRPCCGCWRLRFAFNRMLPSLSWSWAQRRRSGAHPGGLAAAHASHERRRSS